MLDTILVSVTQDVDSTVDVTDTKEVHRGMAEELGMSVGNPRGTFGPLVEQVVDTETQEKIFPSMVDKIQVPEEVEEGISIDVEEGKGGNVSNAIVESREKVVGNVSVGEGRAGIEVNSAGRFGLSKPAA